MMLTEASARSLVGSELVLTVLTGGGLDQLVDGEHLGNVHLKPANTIIVWSVCVLPPNLHCTTKRISQPLFSGLP